MISLEELDKTILELEQRDTTYATCEKLAWLYIVKDHIQPIQSQTRVSYTGSVNSEFIKSCENVPVNHVLSVLDEHMSAIQSLYPKEYNAIISKIAGFE